MSSAGTEIWNSISNQATTLAEKASQAVVAVDAGRHAAASGVYWKAGVIVTASHLVRRAENVSVLLPDGSTIKAALAGRDSSTDIAVIRVPEDAKLSTLPAGTNVKVGELVLAVARSGRGELSASAGIVARVGQAWHTWRGGQIDRLIRPDVRLYPGQSGSALINGRGELLGINSSALARESVITVPVETVNRVVTELLERGHIAQPYLGLAMQEVPLPQEWKAQGGERQETGLLVMHVAPGGPSQQAGVNLGDVIVSVDGQPVEGYRQLRDALARKSTGAAIQLRLLRAGAPVEVSVTLGDRPRR